MIRKIVSILLIFTALVAFIGGAAVAALRIVFPDEKLREIFVNSGRWYLRRDVSLERLSLGMFSGLELRELAVSEQPDFRAGTFLSAGRVRLKVRLLPLLRRDVNISELRIENPQARISRGKNGTLNFEDLGIAYGSPGKTDDVFRAAVPLPFLITDVEVTGGRLSYADAALRGLRVELADIAVSAGNVSPRAPFDAQVSFVIAGKKTPVRARLSVDIPCDRIEVVEGVVGTGDAVLRLSGSFENVAGDGAVRLALDAEGDVAVLNDLCGMLPRAADLTLFPLPRVRARISGTPAALSVRFR